MTLTDRGATRRNGALFLLDGCTNRLPERRRETRRPAQAAGPWSMKLAALTGDTAAYSVCTNMWPWQLGDGVALAYRAIGQTAPSTGSLMSMPGSYSRRSNRTKL